MKLALSLAGLSESPDASDRKEVTFGVRKFTYEVHGGELFLYANGKRILCRGGNWGMDEGMLRCDAAGYDTRVRLHKEMNFNMIRNWVGMTAKDEFYQACDKYGILVWDDFWLANPADGPEPTDDDLFMTNAVDKIRRVRNHPSLILYCGRNESSPPPALNTALRAATEQLDGSRYYIPDSASGTVSGHGPYEVQDANWYFKNRGQTLHSELGIVAVPPADSLRLFLPADKLWPINDLWGMHDLSQQRGPAYIARVNRNYGPATSLEDFCRKAQMVNLESAKAMYEAWQSSQGSGVLVWMTQSAWPCMICQMYDYYFEPTAAYFGAKSACEPLHILWNSGTDQIKVANDTVDDSGPLTADAALYDLQGHKLWSKSATLSVPATSAADCFLLERPADLTGVYFVKLKLTRGLTLVSDNFYWASVAHDHYAPLSTLPQVALQSVGTASFTPAVCTLTATVTNPTTSVALVIRLNAIGASSGKRILPAFYDDNYFSLLPGETKTVRIRFDPKLLNGERPQIAIEGWNIVPGKVPLTKN